MVHSGTSATTFISTTAMLSAVELGNQPKTVDVRHWLNMFTLVRHAVCEWAESGAHSPLRHNTGLLISYVIRSLLSTVQSSSLTISLTKFEHRISKQVKLFYSAPKIQLDSQFAQRYRSLLEYSMEYLVEYYSSTQLIYNLINSCTLVFTRRLRNTSSTTLDPQPGLRRVN